MVLLEVQSENLNYARYGIYFLYLGVVSGSITLIYPPSTALVRSLDALTFSFSPKPNIFRISELEIPYPGVSFLLT